MISHAEENNESPPVLRIIVFALLGFAAVSFITSMILDMNSGYSETINIHDPSKGAEVGPVSIKENNTVVEVTVHQNVDMNNWAFVQGELLDANKQYLMGFGGEVWAETGYDSDGRWTESDTGYSAKMTIPKKGQYYFKFNVPETSQSPQRLSATRVDIEQKLASSLPHFVAAVLATIIAVVLFWINNIRGRS